MTQPRTWQMIIGVILPLLIAGCSRQNYEEPVCREPDLHPRTFIIEIPENYSERESYVSRNRNHQLMADDACTSFCQTGGFTAGRAVKYQPALSFFDSLKSVDECLCGYETKDGFQPRDVVATYLVQGRELTMVKCPRIESEWGSFRSYTACQLEYENLYNQTAPEGGCTCNKNG